MGVIERKKKLLMCDQPQLLTATGNIASFETNMVAPLKSCKVEFSPIQEGTGDPSPENVRPISGWTGLEVFKTGKNMIPPKVGSEYSRVFLRNGTKVVASSSPNSKNERVEYYRKDKTLIDYWSLRITSSTTGRNYREFTIVEDCYYFDFKYYPNLDSQLELGTVATDYEPYNGIIIPIDWENEAGTIYGGYVDFATGMLQPTRICKTFDGTENFSVWQSCDGGNWFLIILASSEYAQTVNYAYDICSHFKMKNPNQLSTSDPVGYCGVSYNWIAFSAPYTTATDFKTYLAEQNNAGIPVTIVYPPANISQISNYKLNSVDIKALKGTNNIWSNSNGDTTINYWRH